MANGLVLLQVQCVILCEKITQNLVETIVVVGEQEQNKPVGTVNIHVIKQLSKCIHTLTSVACVVLITPCTSETQ